MNMEEGWEDTHELQGNVFRNAAKLRESLADGDALIQHVERGRLGELDVKIRELLDLISKRG